MARMARFAVLVQFAVAITAGKRGLLVRTHIFTAHSVQATRLGASLVNTVSRLLCQ